MNRAQTDYLEILETPPSDVQYFLQVFWNKEFLFQK